MKEQKTGISVVLNSLCFGFSSYNAGLISKSEMLRCLWTWLLCWASAVNEQAEGTEHCLLQWVFSLLGGVCGERLKWSIALESTSWAQVYCRQLLGTCPSYRHATGPNHRVQTSSSKSWSLVGAELSLDFRQLCCCVSSLLLQYCPSIPKMQHYGSCSHAVWLPGLSSGQKYHACLSTMLCWRSSTLVSKVWVLLVALFFRFSALASYWFGGRESVWCIYMLLILELSRRTLAPMQMCCNLAWQRWSQELVVPADFTGEQELCGGGLVQFSGRNGVSVESGIWVFCGLKPKQWAERAAAVVWRGLGPFSSPWDKKAEIWRLAASLYSPFPWWCLCVGHFGGFTKSEACVRDMYCCWEENRRAAERGGLKASGARSRGNWKRWIFVTVAWSETKSQHLRQTITRPELTELLSCEAFSIVAVLLC